MTIYRIPDLPETLSEVWDLGGDHWVRVDDEGGFVPPEFADQPETWIDRAVDWPELVAECGPLSDTPPERSDP